MHVVTAEDYLEELQL